MANCGMLGESNTKTRMTPVCLQFIFLPSHWYPHSYSVINAGLKFDAFFTFRDTCHGLHWPIWPHCNGWGKTPLYVWSVLVGREDVMVTATVYMYDLRWLAGKTWLWLPLSVCMICACWQGRRDDDCHCLYDWSVFVDREDVTMTAAERAVHTPPPSLVPRLHAVVIRKLAHNNPLLPHDLSAPSQGKCLKVKMAAKSSVSHSTRLGGSNLTCKLGC